MILKRFAPYTRVLWFRIALALILMACVALISTGTMWMIRYLVDQAMADKDIDALKIGIFVIISAFGLKAIFWYTHTYLSSFVSQMVSLKLRNDVYRHLYNLSMGFFNEKDTGGILARITNDISTLQISLAAAPTTVVRDGLTIIGLTVFLFYLHWKFALLCFAILPITGYILYNFGVKSRRAGRESQARMADMYATIQEGIMSMPIVKAFQNEKKEITDFEQQNRNYFNVMMKLVRIEARSSPIMEIIGSWVLALMLFIGGRDVIAGHWSLGSFISFMGAALSLYNPLKQFARINVQMQLGLAAAERVFNLLDQKPTVIESSNPIKLTQFNREINFENVDFAYPQSDQVLHGLTLKIKKGEVVALVGPSGAGKTTVALLLLRFYDPTAGAISLDGHDMRSLSLETLRRQMAVVTQETHLFNDSVKANIAYGKPDASDDEIRQAARDSFAHDFIMALPNGYETIIGERGARLSGGERQRLAIARSLLKNPSILILDEATSALDAESEQMVQKAFDRLLEGRTVLIIAHRLATVKKAHRIIVLENGRIKESGKHDELLKLKGSYNKLFELQTTF